MLARLKRFSFISIPNDRQFVKRVSEKILMDLAILRGICSLQAEKTFFHGILWEEQLGGASADAQSYWQGRFAVCAFVGDFLGIGRTRNSWGVALNPTRDRREGTKSPLDPARGNFPLDPFSRLSWSRFHTSSACGFFLHSAFRIPHYFPLRFAGFSPFPREFYIISLSSGKAGHVDDLTLYFRHSPSHHGGRPRNCAVGRRNSPLHRHQNGRQRLFHYHTG